MSFSPALEGQPSDVAQFLLIPSFGTKILQLFSKGDPQDFC